MSSPANKATIVLNGQAFEVGPFTLGQMKAIGIGAAKQRSTAPKKDAKGVVQYDAVAAEAAWYDSTFAMIAEALHKSVEEVEGMTGVTFDELFVAKNTILEVSGLITNTEEPKGGGRKGTEGEAGSGESTPGSQQASDGHTAQSTS